MAPIGTVCTIIATVDRIVQKQPRPRMQVTEVSLVDETGVLQVAFSVSLGLPNSLSRATAWP